MNILKTINEQTVRYVNYISTVAAIAKNREGVWGPPSVGLNVAMCAWRPWGNAEVGGAPSEAGRGEGEAGGEGHRRMLQWRAHQVGPQMGTILVLALTPSVVRSSLKE